MRRIRVIPVLLLDSTGRLVKSVRFGKRTYIGDPMNAVRIFNEKGVDELILLDIDVTRYGHCPNYELIEDIACEAFMPVGYGGGIRDIDQARRLFQCGLEKIVLSSAAFESSALIGQAADRFGSQSIVVCLDVRNSWLKGQRVWVRSGLKTTGMSPVSAARQAAANGAGELFVYAIDRDGTYSGYDTPILQSITRSVEIPVVACGGAGSINDFVPAIVEAGCSAVAAGSMFVYQSSTRGVLISYPSPGELEERLFCQL